MNKDELMNFDLVTLYNGQRYFVWKNHLVSLNPSWTTPIIPILQYSEDLLHPYEEWKVIMEVRRYCPVEKDDTTVTSLHAFMNNMLIPGKISSRYMKVIWKRGEVKEVTMDEIAKKFGVPVENLKIKK